jgi:hypothetical protein
MILIDDQRQAANQYLSTLSSEEKQSIIDFMQKNCKSNLEGVYNIPRLVFLNGYFYGKTLHSGKVKISEYLESPFVEMAKSVYFDANVNARTSELDNFINNPTEEQKAASACFSKGFDFFRKSN